jgi:2',3'-cyclic-nucleotide 2'-phosphodiesterase (5'-nucleotidase family)
MLPVDSTIRVAKATGKQLKEWLEKELNNVFAKDASKRLGGWVVKFKGMEMSFNAFGEMGKRVQSITVKGKALDMDKYYSVLACERDGDPADMLCRLKGVADAKNTDTTLHKVMINYIKNNSPVTPLPPKNATILDAPSTLLSQVTGVDYVFR